MRRIKIFAITLGLLAIFPVFTRADLLKPLPPPGVAFTLSPQSGTVLTDSTFELDIFLDTRGKSVNAVELNLKFPADKLNIINPSGGKSFISIWSQPPTYSNTDGTANFSGGIPGGINTQAGLITAITFKAKSAGSASIQILPSSKVLANDGQGTEIPVQAASASFVIIPKAPDGPVVSSETHPLTDTWYNNPDPALSWEKDPGVTDFSFVLDSDPATIPDNTPETGNTSFSYQNLKDGAWYFHIKARKDGVWGPTTNFRIQIDTSPPADFKPQIQTTSGNQPKTLVSFFTTDFLSGIDHYEVGVVDNQGPPSQSPAFIEAQSPYQLPVLTSNSLRVVVRAVDKAGNVKDEFADVSQPSPLINFVQNYELWILAAFLLLIFSHYLFSHHLWSRIRKFWAVEKEISREEDLQEERTEQKYLSIPMPPPPASPAGGKFTARPVILMKIPLPDAQDEGEQTNLA